MPRTKIESDGYQCFRCEHTWIPRKKRLPVVCPKCKSPYWNIKGNIRNAIIEEK